MTCEYSIGRCPKCESPLTKRDIEINQIRSTFWRPHFAYTCRKCDAVIGFGTNAPW